MGWHVMTNGKIFPKDAVEIRLQGLTDYASGSPPTCPSNTHQKNGCGAQVSFLGLE